jgi:DNA-binding transcriptional ArsR family regulator
MKYILLYSEKEGWSENMEHQTLINRTVETLKSVPDVQVLSIDKGDRFAAGADAHLGISVQGRRVDLLLAVRQAGYPRDAREAMWRLASLKSQDVYPLFVAPSISPGARELLRADGLGYADAGGSLCLRLPWAYLFVERPPVAVEERKAKTLFRGSRAQVLHMMLNQPERTWHVQDLAACAEVALSTVHQVFRALEDEGYVERKGKGPEVVRRLSEPGKLLDAWAKAHTLKEYQACGYYAWSQSLPRLRAMVGAVLEEVGTSYALTLASGAELSAPFATRVETLSFVLPKAIALDPIAERAKLKPVEEGANVTLLLASGKALLLCRRKIEEVWVASDVQLYLDLFASPARGKEQAMHLRRERLSF